MKPILLLSILSLLTCGTLHAQDAHYMGFCYYKKAVQQLDQDQFQEAAQYAQQAIDSLGGTNPPLQYLLVMAHYKAGHPIEANTELQRYILLDDQNPSIQHVDFDPSYAPIETHQLESERQDLIRSMVDIEQQAAEAKTLPGLRAHIFQETVPLLLSIAINHETSLSIHPEGGELTWQTSLTPRGSHPAKFHLLTQLESANAGWEEEQTFFEHFMEIDFDLLHVVDASLVQNKWDGNKRNYTLQQSYLGENSETHPIDLGTDAAYALQLEFDQPVDLHYKAMGTDYREQCTHLLIPLQTKDHLEETIEEITQYCCYYQQALEDYRNR